MDIGPRWRKSDRYDAEGSTEALQYISTLTNMMDEVAGFGNILSGSGEAGVRAGNHAQTLLKTASPRLRDRSLIVERQYAAHGDTILHYMEAKDGQEYYFDPDKPEESSFLLSQIPEDRRVVVDSHSTSPVYENDNIQLTTFLFTSAIQPTGSRNVPRAIAFRRSVITTGASDFGLMNLIAGCCDACGIVLRHNAFPFIP